MIPRLSPVYLRATVRLMDLYPEAAAHVLAEEEAAEAVSLPSVDGMVAARVADLASTSEGRARFSAYLDRLSVTHAHDPVMVAFVRRERDRLVDGPAYTAPADEGATA